MLTEKELNKIFSWLPYSEDWAIGDVRKNNSYYDNLIFEINNNPNFQTYYSQEGGFTNYLEFYCYPIKHQQGRINSIIVCVSLCAPIVCYGQTSITIDPNFISHNFLAIENVLLVPDDNLKHIEKEIRTILNKNKLVLIDKEFASQDLPDEVYGKMENLNEGEKYLHGLFQWID